jgi:toxin ParE1/3/4
VPQRGRIVVTGPASRDIDELWHHISVESSPDRADTVVARLQQGWNRLAILPRMGRPETQLGSGVRSIYVEPYRVFYLLNGRRIEIMRVVHTRRDLATAWRQDESTTI